MNNIIIIKCQVYLADGKEGGEAEVFVTVLSKQQQLRNCTLSPSSPSFLPPYALCSSAVCKRLRTPALWLCVSYSATVGRRDVWHIKNHAHWKCMPGNIYPARAEPFHIWKTTPASKSTLGQSDFCPFASQGLSFLGLALCGFVVPQLKDKKARPELMCTMMHSQCTILFSFFMLYPI